MLHTTISHQYVTFNISYFFASVSRVLLTNCWRVSIKYNFFCFEVNANVDFYFLLSTPGCFHYLIRPGGSFEDLVSGLHWLHQLLSAQIWISAGGGHHAAHLPWPLPLPVYLLSGSDARTTFLSTCLIAWIYIRLAHTWRTEAVTHFVTFIPCDHALMSTNRSHHWSGLKTNHLFIQNAHTPLSPQKQMFR